MGIDNNDLLAFNESMAITAGVGSGQGNDAYEVGVNACKNAFDQLGQPDADLVIVFSSVVYDQKKVIEGVRSVSKNALLVGSSTAGEITNNGPAKKSVVVMVIKSDQITFAAGAGNDIKTDAKKAGHDAADQVKKQLGDKLKTFILLTDTLSGNGSEVLRGVLDVVGQHFPVVGGGSGDDAQYKQTFQYFNNDVLSGSAVGLGLAGSFKFSMGVKHGWVSLSPVLKVTKSSGAIVQEIDGNPAIEVYEKYLGTERAQQLKETVLAKLALSYPLGMQVEGSDELLLRAPFFVDKQGSITCGGEVPQGSEVRIMVGSSKEAIEAAKQAAQKLLDQLGSKPKAILLFNCHVRDKLLGPKAKEEIDAMQEIIGKDVPLIGFYTYAEQAPLAGEVRNIERCNPSLHNETVAMFALGE
ncbi:hypothetical protein A3H40_01250 [Candidatus Daviesbacteria bacterium RIFCSPLOWO2_02_FULL_38_15]|uniref:FIST domain-containing protein n=2 Tax=Candidatus Daviesiibacteriota TaxID=1752718 RepID=A0A1F5N1W0_9BACT|nr:MAG: hypothetical protein A3H40_01250 [Candidatus Daviesbacteria bacterium RIFCSPLOWO2_02_FULL_38_15]